MKCRKFGREMPRTVIDPVRRRIVSEGMRIAQVAPLFERVPPDQYGGTERVVAYLTDELVARGHSVTLFASGDSVTRARLVAACERSLRVHAPSLDPVAVHLAMLLRVYERAKDFDVIHCHTDYIGLPLSRSADVPTVLTLHGRLDLREVHPVYRGFPNVALVSISTTQRAPLEGVRWAATVHHGLPRSLYRFDDRPGRRHLLFLGRTSPEKGPDAAIRVAIRAGVPLKIAAKVDRADRKYFDQVVRPLLDNPLVEFVGEVDDEEKASLLGGALALLFPVDWPEPFGMVVIEALASGTPIIARARGSVPELLTHGRTGFVCETEDEMVAAVGRVADLERRACREEFERRFSAEAMTDAYLRVYERARTAARDRIRIAPAAHQAPALPV
jgi:glycosyltransferase involved in cell wall biosynthesis